LQFGRRWEDGYNVAMSGSTSESLPVQLELLKTRGIEDSLVENSDILLTLLIGANDLCMWDCHRPIYQLKSFTENVKSFISDSRAHFGSGLRILIGLLPALEGIPSRAFGSGMEAFALLECPCAYKSNELYPFATRIEAYNAVLEAMARNNSDFVWITSVLRDEELKDWPPKMTSELDRFHPSKWAQEHFALKIFEELMIRNGKTIYFHVMKYSLFIFYFK
jgi:hypothetical protein